MNTRTVAVGTAGAALMAIGVVKISERLFRREPVSRMYVLCGSEINADCEAVRRELSRITGVTVRKIHGDYDILAIVEGRQFSDVAEAVMQMYEVAGIKYIVELTDGDPEGFRADWRQSSGQSAWVMLSIHNGYSREVVSQVSRLPHIIRATPIVTTFDALVEVNFADHDQLFTLISGEGGIRDIPGVFGAKVVLEAA